MRTDVSRLVRGPIGSTQRANITADIIAEIPVAPIACLFATLFILVAAMQIFPQGPPGFQKELNHRDVPNEILVRIDRTSRITIDGTPANGDRVYLLMESVVDEHRAKHLSRHIVVMADPRAAWASAITVLDAARQADDDDLDLRPPLAAGVSSAARTVTNETPTAP